MVELRIVAGRTMQALAVIFMIFCIVFGASRVHADDRNELPPLGIWVGQNAQPDFLLDLKTDKTPNAGDISTRVLPLKKEPAFPFVGLTLTRPFEYRN